jgi:hypothetical protein
MLRLENPTPVALQRDLVKHDPGEPDRSQLDSRLRVLLPETQITWSQLLRAGSKEEPLEPILFTAPSGSGKSTELHFLARQLRNDGKVALAVEASRVAAGELEKGLDSEELAVWNRWKLGSLDERACIYLLLDAVDELYLGGQNSQDLSAGLRANELLGPKVRMVVSSRDDTWGPEESQWLRQVSADICAGTKSSEEMLKDDSNLDSFVVNAGEGFAGRTIESGALDGKKVPSPGFTHIKLGFLASHQVSELASLFGLEQPEGEGFLAALNSAEIEGLFPFRPRDVKALVGYWHAHRNFDSWTDVLEWQVRNAYQELNRARGRHQELSLERYVGGIRRIAAVTTFSPVRHVLRPDSPTVKDAPHAEDLFPEWKPSELNELFASPLLVRKGPASQDSLGVAVQIVQGQVADYLAADWAKDVYLGGAEDSISKTLFVVPPQHKVECVPEEHRSVAGWLAGMLPQVRKRLLEVAPEVALYRGDPARLSIDEVRQALEAVIKKRATGHYEYRSSGQVARIARPELSDLVAQALTNQQLPDHLAYELLQVAREGAFRGGVASALLWALNEGAEEYTRKRAIELVAELGTEREKQELLAILGTDAPAVRVALFRALVPQYIVGESLVDFLARENNGDIVYEIRKRGLPLSPGELCQLVGVLLSRLLKGTPSGAADCRYEEAEDGTALLALEALQIRALDPRPLEPEFCEFTICVDSHELDVYFDKEQEAAIRTALCSSHWESVWEARLKAEKPWNQQFNLCPIVPSRFEWVMEKLELLGSGTAYDQLWRWVTDFLGSLTEEGLAQLESIVSPASHELVERWEATRIEHQEAARLREDERERQKATKREENDAAWRPHLNKIRQGEHQDALQWAYHYVPRASLSRTGKLNEVVSPDVAQALTEGFRNWWRKCNPSRDCTGTTYGDAWGLVGVALEISAEGLKEIQSDEEIRIATLLALRELNSVPAWLKELHTQRPSLVECTIRQAIVAAWDTQAGRSSYISHLRQLDAPKLIDSIAEEILTLIRSAAPAAASTLDNALDLLLRAPVAPPWLADLAARETKRASDVEFRKQWLRLWCHLDGEVAAKWLADVRKLDSSWDQVIRQVCEKVHYDLDRRNPAKWSNFFSTESVQCWFPLLIELDPPEKAFRRPGRGRVAQAWSSMDHTREVLDACKSSLVADGSVYGTTALNALSIHPDPRVGDWAREMLPFQRLNAAKQSQELWTVGKLLEAERLARRVPLTTAELCDVVLGEIRRVDNQMRNGDFAYPQLFTSKLSENDIQRWVAAQLELVGKRTFYVGREGEVKDGNKMDIVAIRPSLGRVPIEIKPIFESTSYSLTDLQGTIDEQLIAKYMRPAEVTHGVLLLVRLVERQWQLKGRLVDFHAGVDHLRSYAARHAESGKSVAVAVIDIEAADKKQTTAGRKRRGKSQG